MGKQWENHRKTIGKPWGNHRKTIGKWWFHGIWNGIYPLVNNKKRWSITNLNGKSHYFNVFFFNSCVSLLEGRLQLWWCDSDDQHCTGTVATSELWLYRVFSRTQWVWIQTCLSHEKSLDQRPPLNHGMSESTTSDIGSINPHIDLSTFDKSCDKSLSLALLILQDYLNSPVSFTRRTDMFDPYFLASNTNKKW